MAVIYLSSVDGSDGDNGSTWALAKATLAAALTAAGAGGTVYMDNAHAQTQASAMTLTSPGTAASPVTVLCVSRASGAPPTTLATTGTVSTTGANNLTFGAGVTHVRGVTFNAGSGASTASILNATSGSHWRLERCVLKLNNTSASSFILFGHDSGLRAVLIDCDMEFGNVGQSVLFTSNATDWIGGALRAGAAVPTTLFQPSSGSGRVRVRGVDLSQAGSGKNLVLASGATAMDVLLEGCKLGSSVSITTGNVASQSGVNVRLVNCDSADTNYRYYFKGYQGDITQETTIVRTGGATDGTTPVSRKMVSSANSKFYSPLESDPIVFWNETLGSITATVEVVTDGVTLTDAEAWLEPEYPGTSGFPLSLTASDRAADILATPANQTSSSETWTTTGLSSPVKQKLSVTFTPAEKGPVRVRVMLAKASTTMYFCPLVIASSGRQWMTGEAYINDPASSGGAAPSFGTKGPLFRGAA